MDYDGEDDKWLCPSHTGHERCDSAPRLPSLDFSRINLAPPSPAKLQLSPRNRSPVKKLLFPMSESEHLSPAKITDFDGDPEKLSTEGDSGAVKAKTGEKKSLKKRLWELNWRGNVPVEASDEASNRTSGSSEVRASPTPPSPRPSTIRSATRTPTPTHVHMLPPTKDPLWSHSTGKGQAKKPTDSLSPGWLPSLSPTPTSNARKSVIWSDQLERSCSPREDDKDAQELRRFSSAPSSGSPIARNKLKKDVSAWIQAKTQLKRDESITALPTVQAHASYPRPHSAPLPDSRPDISHLDNRNEAEKKQSNKLRKKSSQRIGGEYKKIGGPIPGTFSHLQHLEKGASVENLPSDVDLAIAQRQSIIRPKMKQRLIDIGPRAVGAAPGVVDAGPAPIGVGPSVSTPDTRIRHLRAFGPTEVQSGSDQTSLSSLSTLFRDNVKESDPVIKKTGGNSVNHIADPAGRVLPSIEEQDASDGADDSSDLSQLDDVETTSSVKEEKQRLTQLEEEIEALRRDESPVGDDLEKLRKDVDDEEDVTDTGEWEDMTERETSVDDDALRRVTFETGRSVLISENGDKSGRAEVEAEETAGVEEATEVGERAGAGAGRQNRVSFEIGPEEEWEDLPDEEGDVDADGNRRGRYKAACARGSRDLGVIWE